MPVKKTKPKTTSKTEKVNLSYECKGCSPHNGFGAKLIVTFVGILLAYLIVFFGVLIRSEIKEYRYIGLSDEVERLITLEAQGTVSARPDVATLRVGMTNVADSVTAAQTENTKVMKSLVSQLKVMGVDEKDIQTEGYNVYPKYEWSEDNERVFVGYEASDSLAIKIRKKENIGKVLTLAGEVGATNIGNLEWVVEEKEIYLDQARAEALQKIGKKAYGLTQALGVEVISVVSYNEYETSQVDFFQPAAFGGAVKETVSVESGSEDVALNVSVTFEIR